MSKETNKTSENEMPMQPKMPLKILKKGWHLLNIFFFSLSNRVYLLDNKLSSSSSWARVEVSRDERDFLACYYKINRNKDDK